MGFRCPPEIGEKENVFNKDWKVQSVNACPLRLQCRCSVIVNPTITCIWMLMVPPLNWLHVHFTDSLLQSHLHNSLSVDVFLGNQNHSLGIPYCTVKICFRSTCTQYSCINKQNKEMSQFALLFFKLYCAICWKTCLRHSYTEDM